MIPSQVSALAKETQRAFDGWLDRVVKNGYRDAEAIGQLAALAGQLRILETIEMRYLS